MKINYQIMEESQRNRFGKYIPDYARLIGNASSKEEADHIRKIRDRDIRYLATPGNEKMAGFVWNMVYVAKQKCGHYEMFQTPQNNYHPLNDILREAQEYAEKMDCSCCICGCR